MPDETPELPLSSGAPKVRCPHCGKVNPDYGINIAGLLVPQIGLVESLTFSCASCQKIISIQCMHFSPAPEFIDRMRSAAPPAGKGN